MNNRSKNNICRNCQEPTTTHKQKWFDEIISQLLIPKPLLRLNKYLEKPLDKILNIFFFKQWSDLKESSHLPQRTQLLIQEAKKRNAIITSLGKSKNICFQINNKKHYFEDLPHTHHKGKISPHILDDKKHIKKILQDFGLPTPKGRAFWFFEAKQSMDWTKNNLNFPIVVKPRTGSAGKHVHLNIKNFSELKLAIEDCISYSPTYIIEEYIKSSNVFRMTVIGKEKLFCAKQIPAHAIGNGQDSLKTLIENKNKSRDDKLHFPITTNNELITKQNVYLDEIIANGKIIFLQNKPLMKLGADIAEITPDVHEENKELFINLTKKLKLDLIGIDFLIPDIKQSWKNQKCAILEVNTVPCLEMHHLPVYGEPQNPTKHLFNQMLKN